MVGILVSFWDTLFSGAMLVSGRVLFGMNSFNLNDEQMNNWFGAKHSSDLNHFRGFEKTSIGQKWLNRRILVSEFGSPRRSCGE